MDSYYATMLNRRNANFNGKVTYRRDDCFLADSQVEFRSMWRTHFNVEASSETLRQRLINRPLFNINEAFNSLDLNADGRVTAAELRRLIESRGYAVNEKDIGQVLDRFDKNRDG